MIDVHTIILALDEDEVVPFDVKVDDLRNTKVLSHQRARLICPMRLTFRQPHLPLIMILRVQMLRQRGTLAAPCREKTIESVYSINMDKHIF